MPIKLISCVSLPPATISSVPIYDFAIANEELASKNVCGGCIHSCRESGNDDKCPFCNSEGGKTEEEDVEDNMKRVEANDPASIYVLAGFHYDGFGGLQQDQSKAMELYAKAAELGNSEAHSHLGNVYRKGANMKKAAAMAGHEVSRNILGNMEYDSGNVERAIKHWTIGASAGNYMAMHHLRLCFELGAVSRESIDSVLAAYNSSCAEMRSEARDAYIQYKIETI